MRNTKTHQKTIKKKLNKCKNVFHAFNDIQLKYGELLDVRDDIKEIKCNVKINCGLGDSFTSDIYCVKQDDSVMVRECVFKDRLLKPLTLKMLDASRDYWLSAGVNDWGIVLDE